MLLVPLSIWVRRHLIELAIDDPTDLVLHSPPLQQSTSSSDVSS